jgi:hypothetical protein
LRTGDWSRSGNLGGQDIKGEKLYIVNLSKGPSSLKVIDTSIPIGVTADIEGSAEVILAGAKDGITKFNVQNASHEYVAKFWNENDGPDKAKEYVFPVENGKFLLLMRPVECGRTTVLWTVKGGSGLAQ